MYQQHNIYNWHSTEKPMLWHLWNVSPTHNRWYLIKLTNYRYTILCRTVIGPQSHSTYALSLNTYDVKR